MAISDKARKFLWAKSGNRCAICKTELITNEDKSSDFNIGEECHIISSKPNGPRHIHGLKEYDNFENLILLCRNHHKQIDELTDTYTEEILRYIKANHENWVRSTITNAIEDTSQNEKPRFLAQVTSGKELFNIINEAHGYRTDYDEVKDEEEMNYIAGIIQSFVDYGDISGMVEAYDKVRMAYDLQKLLDELDEKGFMVFADRGLEPMFSENPRSSKWTVATILLKKKENPEIIKVEFNGKEDAK
ncbi:hypothetical protein CPT03_08495 [Pedobacter ginsengisoli]|uniref:HNH nuclease domain-containing protein n=1 Tax=Pedobacter ginsengisoli TaxID=363852 RepID=A0A2D1U4H5_9SPHI|nr:HNH endonuclease signature motif containing protein [Pedobacter ginsengisoli]ATP56509.1 hypothetical protein CPT03_08495 [Pedobacter ginsengisoli]